MGIRRYKNGMFAAETVINGKTYEVGTFVSETAAKKAIKAFRQEAAANHHGTTLVWVKDLDAPDPMWVRFDSQTRLLTEVGIKGAYNETRKRYIAEFGEIIAQGYGVYHERWLVTTQDPTERRKSRWKPREAVSSLMASPCVHGLGRGLYN